MIVFLEILVGGIATFGTTVSVATYNQIQDSDRSIVRLETKIATLERTIYDYRSANEEIMVLQSQVSEIARRVEKLETH